MITNNVLVTVISQIREDQIKESEEWNEVSPVDIKLAWDIWKFEGSVGRFAMNCLEAGICYLGTDVTRDYYGNTIPARQMIQAGSKGSMQNAFNFWQRVENGDFDAIEALEQMFAV